LERGYSNIIDTFEVDSFTNSSPMRATPISIGFIERITSAKTYLLIDFTLARVKINNRTRIKVGEDVLVKNLSADLIDMSFCNPGDTKSKGIHTNVARLNKREHTERVIGKIKLPFLTSHYLFYDLCNMIVEEGVYPWSDKKYAKRLGRLITMGVISSFSCDSSKENMLKQFDTILKTISNMDHNKMDVSANYMTALVTGFRKHEIDFSIRTNPLSYMMLKSLTRILLTHKFIRGTVTPAENQFISDIFTYVLIDKSVDMTANELRHTPVSVTAFEQYLQNIALNINFYKNLLEKNKDQHIYISDTENIVLGNI
jgi:hypothetical protein